MALAGTTWHPVAPGESAGGCDLTTGSSSTERKIAFKLELSRMLDLLADQIYQSPLALLPSDVSDRLLCRFLLGHGFLLPSEPGTLS